MNHWVECPSYMKICPANSSLFPLNKSQSKGERTKKNTTILKGRILLFKNSKALI